ARVAPAVGVLTASAVTGLAAVVAVTRPTVSVPFLPRGPLALSVDGLAALTALTVAAVSLLVLAYSTADIDSSQGRYFGLMLIFVAAVLVTVTAASLPALLMAWEVMGATSYALIAFHWRDEATVAAGTTAFVTTRLGDLGLYLAAGATLAVGVPSTYDRLPALPGPWRDVAAAGVLAAAFGKAAQLPFSFWLSRAMLGPSPVSALLHSAAMVAMGGYLLVRLHPLLAATGWAVDVAAWGGAATALALGVVAVAQDDLKQLLAASTCAQLGYVVLGGALAPAGGAAHLVAHAATKSLLFLAAGAWLTALGTRRLSALRGAGRRYRLVGAVFAAGALALAGVPPLSLWATKDEVLAGARERSVGLYAVGLAGAVLSALYSGKALGIVLRPATDSAIRHGGAGYDTERAGTRRVRPAQVAPMVVLALGAVGLGVLVLPPLSAVLDAAVGGGPPPTAAEVALSGALAIGAVAVGVAVPGRLPAPRWALGWLGLGHAAHTVVVRPTLTVAHALARFDDAILDRAVTALPSATRRLATRLAAVDDLDVDGLVRAVARGARRLGALARRPQTGLVHQYYAQAVALLGVAVLLLVLLTR
ncbi:MAG TPA: proton-conducting transporter membrane subunit, partial [Micromonosporaceae bacterium]